MGGHVDAASTEMGAIYSQLGDYIISYVLDYANG
jgi:hypothetical protein